MNNNKKTIKILLLILSLAMLTGCTKTLTGEDKKPVKYEETGKALTENVLCRPTDENVVNIYKENNVDIDKLPKCETFKPFSEYEGLWTTIFVKPLAWAIINIGLLLEKIGLGKGLANGFAIVISCLVILSSCLLSFIQIPLLFAFLEAINRTPVIFENKFLKLDMGTTISHGIMSNLWYAYIIFLLLILATSYFSFRKTLKDQTAMAKQMKGTIYFMLAMILVAAFSLPVALGIYWITSSLFTILQNMLVERKKAKK